MEVTTPLVTLAIAVALIPPPPIMFTAGADKYPLPPEETGILTIWPPAMVGIPAKAMVSPVVIISPARETGPVPDCVKNPLVRVISAASERVKVPVFWIKTLPEADILPCKLIVA